MTHLSSFDCLDTTKFAKDDGSLKSTTTMLGIRKTQPEAKKAPAAPDTMKFTTSSSKNGQGLNLEEYTKNFKGDKVFGWQFKAPLKWDKVIMIFSFYIIAVSLLFIFPLSKVRVLSVLWGK